MGTALIGEAAYLLVLTIGIGCLWVRIGASIVLGIVVWVVNHHPGMALALASVSFIATEGIWRGLMSLSTSLRTAGSVFGQCVATVAVGCALIRDSAGKGFLMGTPYPAIFLISAFWLPSLFTPLKPAAGKSEPVSCVPRGPALPAVITSCTTFITMMLQGYALLPFGVLAGFLTEKDLSDSVARRHALLFTASVFLGIVANELSYRLSL